MLARSPQVFMLGEPWTGTLPGWLRSRLEDNSMLYIAAANKDLDHGRAALPDAHMVLFDQFPCGQQARLQLFDHRQVEWHLAVKVGAFHQIESDQPARAQAAGVGTLVTICTRLSEFERVRAIAGRFEQVYCSVGVHPHDADEEGQGDPARLIELADDGVTITPKGRLLLRNIAMTFDRYIDTAENDKRFSRAI